MKVPTHLSAASALRAWLICPLVTMTIAAWSPNVVAQPSPPPAGITVADFWFRPSLELRTRGEYEYRPADTSPFRAPVLTGISGGSLTVPHRWVAHERSRLGLQIERGPLLANLVIEDARVAGTSSSNVPSTTAVHSAFVELHTYELAPSFVRLGRQEVTLGEGRLVGVSDWSLTPRSLDAVRARWVARQFDVEVLAALLSAPGALAPEYTSFDKGQNARGGTGAELYALTLGGHFDPLLQGEVTGLARIARTPLPDDLAPSDTLAWDARLHGELGGITYSAEGVYEVGRVGIPGGHRPLSAWAATARVDWQTSWVLRPKWALSGSYASGGGGPATEELHRFDPLLPDSRSGLGQMGLYAWSNIIEGAFTVRSAPTDELTITLGYRHVRLADSRGAWFSASLFPIGQNSANGASFLGHELDAAVTYSPLDVLSISGGYGAFITGRGARAILESGARVLSAAFLQVRLAVP